jgi:hypothetical protein
MLSFITDVNFNGKIARGLLRKEPSLSVVRFQDVGPQNATDPEVLDRAAKEGRVLLTHDRKTMPNFAYARVAGGEKMPGVIVVNDRMPIGRAIDEILSYVRRDPPADLENLVMYVPVS